MKLIEKLLKAEKDRQINKILLKLLSEYVKNIFKQEKNKNNKKVWIHLNHLLDCLHSESVFFYDEKTNNHFNFKLFYQDIKNQRNSEVRNLVVQKLAQNGIDLSLN